MSGCCTYIYWLYYPKTETIVVVFGIMWKFRIPVLVLIPTFGYINHYQIWPVLNYHLPIMYTFLRSSNNVNCMYYEFLQYYDSWLDYICVFLAVTDILQTFIFHQPIFLQKSVLIFFNATLLLMDWFCLRVDYYCSCNIMQFL